MDDPRSGIPLRIERCDRCGTRLIVSSNGRANFELERTPCATCISEFQLPSQLLKVWD